MRGAGSAGRRKRGTHEFVAPVADGSALGSI
jgi:hypothetical protein